MATLKKAAEVKGRVKVAKGARDEKAKPGRQRQADQVRSTREAAEARGARIRKSIAARGSRSARAAARSARDSGSRTALQKHVDFFDTDHDGKITLLETYRGLRRLGLGAARSAVFGGVINAALGPPTSGAPSLTVNASHIAAGKHGSDTGVYDEEGHFVRRRFDRLFDRYDGDGDGALDREDLARLFEGSRTDLLGHLGSVAEFGLLLCLAGEDRDGRKVLTRRRLEEFYDGSLFYKLADEVGVRRANARGNLSGAIRSSLEELY